jgi:hypothetical protein
MSVTVRHQPPQSLQSPEPPFGAVGDCSAMIGLGEHRLTFPLALDGRNTNDCGVSVTISGQAWLSFVGMDYLGTG